MMKHLAPSRATRRLLVAAILLLGPRGAAARDRLEGPAAESGFGAVRTACWLDGLVRSGVRAHPDLQQIESRIKIARAKAAQARAWPDPTLSLGFMNFPIGSFSFKETPMTGLEIAITQPIPFPGKRHLAGRVGAAREAVTRMRLSEAKTQLGGTIRRTALELIYLRADRVITVRHGKILEALIKIADAKYRVNQGSQADALKARVSRSQIDDRLQRVAKRRERIEAALGYLMGRTPTASFKVPRPPAEPRIGLTLPKLFARAAERRPALRVWRKQIAVERLRRSLARLQYAPDFSIKMAYRYRQDSGMDPVRGRDFWTVGVGIRIPLWSLWKTSAQVREAEAGMERAQAAFRSAKLRMQREIRTAYDAIRRLDRRLRLYRKRILPQARAALDAARASYVVGRVSFVSLLDHQRALFGYELTLWRLRVERAQRWADLWTAVGVPRANQCPESTTTKGGRK